MAVSSGLQKHFDASKKGKRDDTKAKLDAIVDQIDPAFALSFASFHDRILEIVDETPEAESMVLGELDTLNENLKTSRRRHNLKKAASIINAVA